MRTMTMTRMLIAVAAGVLALTACGGVATPSTSTSAAGATPASGGTAVTISAHDFGFAPATLSVAPGSTVTLTFTNTGAVTHSVTAASVNLDLVSDAGATQSATFTAPQSGSISFHCKFHPTTMTGTITVGGAAAPPAATTTPAATPASGY